MRDTGLVVAPLRQEVDARPGVAAVEVVDPEVDEVDDRSMDDPRVCRAKNAPRHASSMSATVIRGSQPGHEA